MNVRLGYLVQFLVLFGFWLLLSDQYNALFLGLGAISALIITLMTHRTVATVLDEPGGIPFRWLWHVVWFGLYVAWLMSRILLASMQLTYLVLHPRMPIEPRFVRMRTRLQRPLSRVILANSITLVPGTMTVRLEGDDLLIHALTPASADDLASGRMQNMIGRFLGEEPEPPPELRWDPPIDVTLPLDGEDPADQEAPR